MPDVGALQDVQSALPRARRSRLCGSWQSDRQLQLFLERGLLVEHLVGLELLRRTTDLWPGARLHHFRTRHGAELDYILEVGREIWGIEVKASRTVDARDLRGFTPLADRTRRLKRRIVVFLGSRRQQLTKAEAIPLESFLEELPC
jgi:predicted AAA+ superfamily ATPase